MDNIKKKLIFIIVGVAIVIVILIAMFSKIDPPKLNLDKRHTIAVEQFNLLDVKEQKLENVDVIIDLTDSMKGFAKNEKYISFLRNLHSAFQSTKNKNILNYWALGSPKKLADYSLYDPDQFNNDKNAELIPFSHNVLYDVFNDENIYYPVMVDFSIIERRILNDNIVVWITDLEFDNQTSLQKTQALLREMIREKNIAMKIYCSKIKFNGEVYIELIPNSTMEEHEIPQKINSSMLKTSDDKGYIMRPIVAIVFGKEEFLEKYSDRFFETKNNTIDWENSIVLKKSLKTEFTVYEESLIKENKNLYSLADKKFNEMDNLTEYIYKSENNSNNTFQTDLAISNNIFDIWTNGRQDIENIFDVEALAYTLERKEVQVNKEKEEIDENHTNKDELISKLTNIEDELLKKEEKLNELEKKIIEKENNLKRKESNIKNETKKLEEKNLELLQREYEITKKEYQLSISNTLPSTDMDKEKEGDKEKEDSKEGNKEKEMKMIYYWNQNENVDIKVKIENNKEFFNKVFINENINENLTYDISKLIALKKFLQNKDDVVSLKKLKNKMFLDFSISKLDFKKPTLVKFSVYLKPDALPTWFNDYNCSDSYTEWEKQGEYIPLFSYFIGGIIIDSVLEKIPLTETLLHIYK